MKTLTLLLIAISILISSKTQASIISSTESLVVDVNNPELIASDSSLFRVLSLGILDPTFDPTSFFARPETVLGFSVQTITREVTVSEVANSNGTTTRTTSDVRTTTDRALTDVQISSAIDLDGFSIADLLFNESSIRLDFSLTDIVPTSLLTLSFDFDSETSSEILSSTTETFVTGGDPNNTNSVSVPSILLMSLLGAPLLLVRRRTA
jgi:hypothetical protein